ncbi:hypothetical protein JCM33374_g3107 [Metschnikowia sp. JCM 33374]|nr:hypothetical protein JCM33374_g3107 [Metschnikowia sp. JCM 33374]
MSTLEQICSKYVAAKTSAHSPQINSVIAGYTDKQRTNFLSAQGVKNVESHEKVSTDSVLCYYSCTKSMTAMAILILWDHGKVDLDAPAKKYLPLLGECGLIEDGQVDEETGNLKYPLKPVKTDITIRHLLLHMSGFAYIISHSSYYHIMTKKHIFTPSMKMFDPNIMPLVFEPGTDWVYGHSFDWLGLIIEAVSGVKLSEFLRENVFSKAAMSSCTFQIHDASKIVQLHQRTKDELKVFKAQLPVPLTAEVDMGGHGCFGTVDDYLKFLRIWLNYGTSPDTGNEILSRKAVEYAIQNHLSSGKTTDFPVPFADPKNGYSLIGCGYNVKALETGRPAGALHWAGLANLYFWLDFENGCAGFWGCQIMPYMDKVCVEGFAEFEAAVYQQHMSKTPRLQVSEKI